MCYLFRKILILIACILMILFISACKSPEKSIDGSEGIPSWELLSDDYLATYGGVALKYYSLEHVPIKMGWYDLNKGDIKIWGTFYGVLPFEESYIALDVSLKENSHYNMLYVIGHEVCHYAQWRNGVKFDLTHLHWQDRWYEQECVASGWNFVWFMQQQGESNYEGL